MIETERLLLRRFDLRDFEDYYAMSSDPVPYAPTVSDRRTGWQKFLSYIGHWTVFGYGDFAVADRASGRFIGLAGLSRRERGLGAEFDACDEGAWWFVARDRGKGMGIEAVTGMHTWYDANRGPRRTVCIISAANEPSLRIADRAGYREYGRCEYAGEETIMFERVPG